MIKLFLSGTKVPTKVKKYGNKQENVTDITINYFTNLLVVVLGKLCLVCSTKALLNHWKKLNF